MGTGADFYVGSGKDAEWLGSITWDGYEIAEFDVDQASRYAVQVRQAKTEIEFRNAVTLYLGSREDATWPEQGWPWPWATSATTDYVYWFQSDGVYSAVFDEERDWPDMTARQNVMLGKRSGVIVIGG